MPGQTSATPGRFCWFELNVPDPAAAISFYKALFGWTTAELPMPGFTYHVWKKDGKDFGGIMNTSGPEWQGVPPHWMTYVVVSDTDAAAARVTELGGNVCVPPTDIMPGRFSVINDPSGGTISIISLREPGPVEPVMAWNELMTTDAKAAGEFYIELLGWSRQVMPMPDIGEYTMFGLGEEMVAGMMQMDGPEFTGVPSHWLNYVDVKGIEALAGRVVELGGTMMMPITHIAAAMGRLCVFRDPQGAVIAMYEADQA